MTSPVSARLLHLGILIAFFGSVGEAQQAVAPPEPSAVEAAAPAPSSASDLSPGPAAHPAKVSCQGDQLTIEADGSTLRSILDAVQRCTAVPVVLPPMGAEERYFLHLGPGPAVEILESLLASSDLDYVMLPADAAPARISKLLLFARTKSTGDGKATAIASNHEMTPARRAWLATRNTGRAVASADQDDEPQRPDGIDAPPAAVAAGAPSKPSESAPAADAAATHAVSATEVGSLTSATSAGTTAPAATDEAAPDASASTPKQDAAPTETTPSPAQTAPPDPARDNSGAQELQNKITDMQKLFEQRKKLGGDATPDQNQ